MPVGKGLGSQSTYKREACGDRERFITSPIDPALERFLATEGPGTTFTLLSSLGGGR